MNHEKPRSCFNFSVLRMRSAADDDDPATNFPLSGYLFGTRHIRSHALLLQNADALWPYTSDDSTTIAPGSQIDGPAPRRYLFAAMTTLVIESFPDSLHARLQKVAAAHRRTVPQETIRLIETAIAAEEPAQPASTATQSKWANRKLLPEYEAMLATGAFSGGTDSTQIISEERDAR